MDTTVTRMGSVVVAELRAAGYLESTIGQYEKSIKALVRFAGDHGGVYTPAVGVAFASMTVSPRTGRFSAQRSFDYSRLIGVFDAYVLTGRVDLSCRKRGGGGPRPVSSEFTALAAAWDADIIGRGLAPATRDAYGRVSRAYLVFLESRDRLSRGCRRRQRIGVPRIAVGQVGEVLVVLGGVELPPVLDVHRPHRSGRRGPAGRCEAFPPDPAGAVRRR